MARKKCSKGHVYDSDIYGDNCPFCPQSGGSDQMSNNGTQMIPPVEGGGDGRNQASYGGGSSENSTQAVGSPLPGATEFMGSGDVPDHSGGATIIRPVGAETPKSGRKVMGLLVTYSNNPLGNVYNIYEGKNFIGRAIRECDICIKEDSQISTKHVSILYRAADNKFKFKDEQSSNGTYLNDVLEDEGVLTNFDIVKIGNTKLVFIAIPQVI